MMIDKQTTVMKMVINNIGLIKRIFYINVSNNSNYWRRNDRQKYNTSYEHMVTLKW